MSKLDELIQELCPDGVEYKRLEQVGIFFGVLTGKSLLNQGFQEL